MSTKCTVVNVDDLAIHAYTECFDEKGLIFLAFEAPDLAQVTAGNGASDATIAIPWDRFEKLCRDFIVKADERTVWLAQKKVRDEVSR